MSTNNYKLFPNTTSALSASTISIIPPPVTIGNTLPPGICEDGTLFWNTVINTLYVCENGIFIPSTGSIGPTGTVSGDLIPSADLTYNLGASGARWNSIYAGTGVFNANTVVIGNISLGVTGPTGSEQLYINHPVRTLSMTIGAPTDPLTLQSTGGQLIITNPSGTSTVVGSTGPTGPSGGPVGPTGSIGSTGSSLTGPTGTQSTVTGPTGLQGIQGTTGLQGIQGTTGPTGLQGIQGLQGTTGIQGANGFQGPTGFQGIQGTTGPTGLQGPNGFQGPTGFQGIQGTTGPTGLQGPNGFQGPTGFQGIQGTTGPTGLQGPNGFQGPTGFQGIQGTTGPTGLQGIQGTQGTTGPTGLQGIQGTTGPTGLQGIQGTTGPTGLQGIQGTTGPTGLQGTTGLQGATGFQGIQGTTGPTGLQGIQGTTGPTGFQGIQGTTGPTGLQGTTGLQGATGFQGIQGTTGPTGLQGTTGLQGATGFQGIQGTTGLQGATGFQGIQGTTGFTGPIGAPPALPSTYVAFGSASNTVTGINSFIFDNSNPNTVGLKYTGVIRGEGGLFSTGGAGMDTTVQGSYIGWNNYISGGMDFANNHGLGSGGFTFRDTGDGITYNNVATIKPAIGLYTDAVRLGVTQNRQSAVDSSYTRSLVQNIVNLSTTPVVLLYLQHHNILRLSEPGGSWGILTLTYGRQTSGNYFFSITNFSGIIVNGASAPVLNISGGTTTIYIPSAAYNYVISHTASTNVFSIYISGGTASGTTKIWCQSISFD
jgi:hypothetical protein